MMFQLLTDRQGAVLRALCAGLSEDEVAAALGISPPTVRVHRRQIRLRLGTGALRDQCRMLAEGLAPPVVLRRRPPPPP